MTMIPISQHEQAALLAQGGERGLYVPLYVHGGLPHLDTADLPGAWAIDALAELRVAERELAQQLNRAVETAVNDAVSEGLNSDEFECLGTADAVNRATDALTAKITTAVFEGMKAAGFTIVRKTA